MNEEKPVTSDNKKLSPEEIKRVKGTDSDVQVLV